MSNDGCSPRTAGPAGAAPPALTISDAARNRPDFRLAEQEPPTDAVKPRPRAAAWLLGSEDAEPLRDHAKQHGDRQHRIGARDQHGKAAGLGFLVG